MLRPPDKLPTKVLDVSLQFVLEDALTGFVFIQNHPQRAYCQCRFEQSTMFGDERGANDSHRVRPSGRQSLHAAYSDAEIAAVANHVTARFGAKPPHVTPVQVAKLRPTTSS